MKIDGKKIANEILDDLKERVQKLKEKGITPHLAIILVGDSPQSKSYVEQKELKGNRIGVKITTYILKRNISQRELLTRLNDLNHLSDVHGIIVQRPLPSQIDEIKIDQAVDLKKDVDAFNPSSPYNPPVAEAVLRLLEHIFSSNKEVNQSFKGWLNSQSIVILGKGETGGSPVIRTFQKMEIPFSMVDSKTENPQNITKNADIIISAVGKPHMLSPKNIKRGVVLISVGLSKGEDGKLRGDYSGEDVKEIASFYTPTPGGVGPVNVAMLLKNLVGAAERSAKFVEDIKLPFVS